MDREHIEDSAGKVKGTFEDTAGKVTDDKKLLDEVGSRTTSRQLVFGVTSWRSFLLPGYWRFVTSGKAALPARNEQRGELSGKNFERAGSRAVSPHWIKVKIRMRPP